MKEASVPKFYVVLLFVLYVVLVASLALCSKLALMFDDYQTEKGEAISRFMKTTHGIEIAPEDARYFNVVLTGVDVRFENVDIFPALPRRK
jgi:hypothetical protein